MTACYASSMQRRHVLIALVAMPLMAAAADPAAPVRTFVAGAPGRSAAQIAQLVGETFDLDALATAALGAAPATAEQRRRLGQAIARRIAAETVARGDRHVQTVVARTKPIGPGQWLITTQTPRRNMEPLLLSWRVSNAGGALKIIDVLRDGTSSIGVQRREIATALRRQTLDAVINAMEQRYGGP